MLAGTAAALGYLGDSGPWCALGPAYSREYLLCFYLPLVCAFAFNIIVYALVRRHSRERRVSRTTSLYLLGFVIVWFPSLLRRLQVRQGAARRRAAAAVPTTLGGASTDGAPPPAAAWQVSYMKRSPAGYLLAVGEAVCMPLQGALNAAVYGWSLPSIRRAPHCPLPTHANRASRCILRRTLSLPRGHLPTLRPALPPSLPPSRPPAAAAAAAAVDSDASLRRAPQGRLPLHAAWDR